MTQSLTTPCTAFCGTRRIAHGPLIDVALAIKAMAPQDPVLTFNDMSGAVIDLDLRGSTADIALRLTASSEADGAPGASGEQAGNRARGRPRLGVVAREVTLLPRHWEWLARQPGGASQALRRLVDEARRADGGQTDRKAAQERTYAFLSALAGDLPGYEDVIRALFASDDIASDAPAGDQTAFARRMADWPPDVRAYALALVRPPAPRPA